MARTGAFTNWTTLSSTTTQTPEVTEAINIVLSDAFSNETFNYATKALTYRSTSYTSRLKSIGPIVSQLGNGQSRVTIRLHNGDLGFRDEVTGSYVTSGGKTEFAGQPDKFVGAFVTIRRILTGTVSGNTVSTDLIYLFGKVTGATYSETYFDLDVVTSINLAPSLTDRKVNTKCPWVFKGTECGYSGGLTTCNKLYTDSGGCSGRSNQHRYGGFPSRDSAASIGKVSGLGSSAYHQLIQADTDYTEQRTITTFDESFGVVDDSANDRTIITSITPDWINIKSSKYRVSADRTTATGSITSGQSSLTIDDATSWQVGHGIRIQNAGTVPGTTTLNGAINSSVTTITVNSTANFATSGRAKINNEKIYYGAKSSTQLLNVTRSYDGTSAASHSNGATVTPVNDLVTTVTAINGTTFTLASNAGATVSGSVIWHDDTDAILEAIDDAVANGKTLYIPSGDYNCTALLIESRNSLTLVGDGPGRSVLYSIHAEPLIYLDTANATSHTITIQDLGFYGAGGSGNHGLQFRDTGGNGTYNVTLRNLRFEEFGGASIKTDSGTNATFTMLLEGMDVYQPSTAVYDAIDLWGSNDLTLFRCYVHTVGDNRAAYRIRSGAATLIGCNGIDGGDTASWGVFGNVAAQDGTDNYCRVTLIGCNVEAFTNYGIRCKSGSLASFHGTQIIAPSSGTVTPIKFDYVDTNQAGTFDALSSVQTLGASYTNGYAVHSDGLPFLQLGHRKFTSFYDTNGTAAATFPGIQGTRITGSQNYATTHTGYQKFSGHITLEEVSSPVTPPSNTGFLFAKDTGGVTGLYWRSDGVTELRLDTGSSLTSTQIGFGSGSNTLTGSANFTWDDSAKALTVSKAGANPAIYVTDSTNSITARLGTIAGAPDRAIVGSNTDHPFVLYQNNGEGWGLDTSKHFRPYAGNNTNDIGTSAAKVRTGYFGTSVILGGATPITLSAGSPSSSWTLTLPTTAGTNGQALTTNGSGTTSWSTISASPGGSTTQVQFNDAGSFGGDAGLTYDKTTDALTVVGPTQMSELRLKETGGGSDYLGFKAPASVTTNRIWTLPDGDGTSGQLLSTNGSGVLSFATAGAGVIKVKNTSGATAAVNDVGYIDNAGEYKTTTTEAYGGSWCVVIVGAATGSDIWVARRGRVTVTLNANCSIGDRLVTSTTAGRAKPYTYDHYNLFAVATTANSSGNGGTCEALLYTGTAFVSVSSSKYVYEFGTTAGCPQASRFESTINTGTYALTTTSVPFGTVTAGNADNLLFTGSQLTYLRLYNSTRGTYRNITSVTGADLSTSRINTVATTDSWANGDAITTNSPTVVVSGNYHQEHEFIDTTTVPALSRSVVWNGQGTDITAYASLTFGSITIHPYESFGAGKQQYLYVPSSSQYVAGLVNIPLVNRRYAMRLFSSQSTARFRSYSYLLGVYQAVP